MSIQRPGKLFSSKWAEKGERFDIVESGADHRNGRADIEKGFPKQTMISALKGGVPPWGQDHNGILYQITEAIQWMQAGGLPSFNQDFCNKNNGYSKGTIVQGDDPNRPWVLWQCLEDNNRFNPNQNKVNIINPQNGWIRYPVLSKIYGNILYYDKDGQLLVASPSVQTEFYVSSSEGNDKMGDGTMKNPYFSISKALQQAPATGSIMIYLKASDVHYLTPDGKLNSDKEIDHTFDLQTKNVTFLAYGDDFLDQATEWLNKHTNNIGLNRSLVGLTRPKLIICWTYTSSLDNNNELYISGIRFTRLSGTSGQFYVNFWGIEIEIDRINEMDNDPYYVNVIEGWLISGGHYSFTGCIFNKLPKNGLNHFIVGGGDANGIIELNFSFSNFFVNISNTTFLYIIENVKINSFVDIDTEVPVIPNAPYNQMRSNVIEFFSKPAAYHDHVEIINNPAPSYKNLTTNFQIDMDG